jgi:hypothetical protein
MSILGNNPVKAVDMSFDPLTRDEARRLKDLGYELVIQCAWTGRTQPRVAVANLLVAWEGGLHIATYTSLPTSATVGAFHVKKGLGEGHYGNLSIKGELGLHLLNFNMVDVELPGIRVEAVEDAYAYTKNELKLRAPIYTSLNAWRNYVVPGNSSRLARLGAPLVNAFWDNEDDVDFPHFRYGGWKDEQLVGEQFTGGQYVGGQFVDRNVFRRSFVFPEQGVPEEPVEPEKGDDDVAIVLVKGELGERVYLTDWLSRRYIGIRDSTAVVEYQYIGVKGPVVIDEFMLDAIPLVGRLRD